MAFSNACLLSIAASQLLNVFQSRHLLASRQPKQQCSETSRGCTLSSRASSRILLCLQLHVQQAAASCTFSTRPMSHSSVTPIAVSGKSRL